MAYIRIMGLFVTDDVAYAKYREGMTPVLESYQANFGYDFLVSDVLKSKSNEKINRVFTIEFQSKDSMDRFFSDPAYLKIKKQYFDQAVSDRTTIALFEIKKDQ